MPDPEQPEEDETCNDFVYFIHPSTKRELKLSLEILLFDAQIEKKTGLVEDILQDNEKIMICVPKDKVEDFKKFAEENDIKGFEQE